MTEEIRTKIELSGMIDIDDLTEDIRKKVKTRIADDMADYILEKYDEKNMNRLARKIIDERFCQEISNAVIHSLYEWSGGNGFITVFAEFMKSQESGITLHLIKDESGKAYDVRILNENK